MTDPPTAIAPALRVDLRRAAGFTLGDLEVRPASCELVVAGRCSRLQPRVMQVLVALARARGKLLSREALAEACWGGVTVGDDALNRCIQRLRRVAEAHSGFEIETISRLGYRLVACGPAVQDPPPALARGPGDGVTLAVLPFDNFSGDEEMAWFSDGVSEEILHAIATSDGLRVIGRTSSFHFRGATKVVSRVATELKATHVLDGSVRRSGSRVRVFAQLIECAGQTTLWSDRFERDLANMFALQDEIAGVVAGALRLAFTPAARSSKLDLDAYDLYLQARAVSGTPATIADEVRLLERAVDRDPRFAAAWARLAVARALQARWFSTPETYGADRRRAMEAAERASVLDPTGAATFLARGLLEPARRFAKREAFLDRAVAAAPSDPDILRHASNVVASLGRTRESYRLTALAREIDPLNQTVVNNTAGTLADIGRVEDAHRMFEDARRKWPHYDAPVTLPLMMAAHFGDWETAQPLIEIAAAANGPGYRRALATAQLYRAPIEERRSHLAKTVDRHLTLSGTVNLATIMLMHSVGLREEAFDAVRRSSFDDARGSLERTFMIDIIFGILGAGMRQDARFVELCARLGLCDYWVSTDRWPDCAAQVSYDFKVEARRSAARGA